MPHKILVSLVALIGLLVMSCLLFYGLKGGKHDQALRVSFPFKAGACDYDPARIHFSQEYNFLANIYSPLVEYSADGKLVSAVAEKFEWVGNDAYFTIRPGLKTIDGRPIDALDAERSFKRLFLLDSNTHGDLKDMVCPKPLKGLEDHCPGMSVSGDKRVLAFHFKERKIFLFQMLVSVDFSIIPRGAFDEKTLAITDYRNTSGPYYVKADRGGGNIELAANPYHFHYSRKMPQVVVLVPVDAKDPDATLKLFDSGKIDHIPMFRFPPEKLLAYAAGRNDISLHTTYPGRLFWLAFTRKGRARFSVKERLALGKSIKRKIFAGLASKPGYEEVDQLFPALGDGALSKAHLTELEKAFASVPGDIVIDRPARVWAWTMAPEELEAIKANLPQAKFVTDVLKLPGAVDYAKEGLEEPDLYFLRGDTASQEDISFFSYYLHFQFLHLYGEKGKAWLGRYTETRDREKRLLLAEDLHYKTLINADVVPIAATPYAAIVRKPWRFNFSKFYATNFIWRIVRN